MKSSFTDLFVRKPVVALVVNIAILIVGLVSYNQLNVRQYPRSDSAVVKVTTTYFGASAETVRGYITTQLERVIASADGIDYMDSQSLAGVSTINVYLRLNYDTNAALAQISSKIDQVRSELCKKAQERYKTYVESRRLFRQLPDGRREYLSDEDLMKARIEARQAVDEYCG